MPVMLPLFSVVICLLVPGVTGRNYVDYFDGSTSHGTTYVHDGDTRTVIIDSDRYRSPPTNDYGIYSANDGPLTTSRIFTVTFSKGSYIGQGSTVLQFIDSSYSFGTSLAAFGSGDHLRTVFTTQRTIYLDMSVSRLGGLQNKFYIEMVLTPVNTKDTEIFQGTKYHSAKYIYDHQSFRILASSEYSGYRYTDSSNDMRLYADSGSTSNRQLKVSFSPDSYINTTGVVLIARDGGNNYTNQLISYSKGSTLNSFQTTRWSLYLNVETWGSRHTSYYLDMTVTPQGGEDAGTSPTTLTLVFWIGGSVFGVGVIISVIGVILERRSRRMSAQRAQGYPHSPATTGGSVTPGHNALVPPSVSFTPGVSATPYSQPEVYPPPGTYPSAAAAPPETYPGSTVAPPGTYPGPTVAPTGTYPGFMNYLAPPPSASTNFN